MECSGCFGGGFPGITSPSMPRKHGQSGWLHPGRVWKPHCRRSQVQVRWCMLVCVCVCMCVMLLHTCMCFIVATEDFSQKIHIVCLEEGQLWKLYYQCSNAILMLCVFFSAPWYSSSCFIPSTTCAVPTLVACCCQHISSLSTCSQRSS